MLVVGKVPSSTNRKSLCALNCDGNPDYKYCEAENDCLYGLYGVRWACTSRSVSQNLSHLSHLSCQWSSQWVIGIKLWFSENSIDLFRSTSSEIWKHNGDRLSLSSAALLYSTNSVSEADGNGIQALYIYTGWTGCGLTWDLKGSFDDKN